MVLFSRSRRITVLRISRLTDYGTVVLAHLARGLLSLIDCRDGLTLTVEADSGTYLFHTDSPERVEFATFSAGVGSEVSCGPLDPPSPVVITFQAAPEGSDFAGVPNKIEFMEAP